MAAPPTRPPPSPRPTAAAPPRGLSSGTSARSRSAPGAHFQRVSLAFQDLQYSVQVGRGRARRDKVVIADASGYIRPGTFVAIMGPTGSGKTSLLNILAGRVQAGRSKLGGTVLVNGRPRDYTFKRMTAYVMQDDVMFHTLTVWETLVTAAMLRLPSSTPRARKLELAESIIRELGLGKARDTPIGNSLYRGVSGGERKRTCIAVEMLSNPSLIFLDEPTSGLDSFQALNVMSTLSDLAKSGRTIVSTIHQPRSSIYQLFEYLILLSDGKMLYFGRATAAIDYFDRRSLQCPPHFNPGSTLSELLGSLRQFSAAQSPLQRGDYFMDIISPDRRDPEREATSLARIQSLSDSYEPAAEVRPELFEKEIAQHSADSDGMHRRSKYASNWLTQFRTLLRRSVWQATRDKFPLIIVLVQ
eukprot:SM000731S21910  [mRNA]  locus=s731:11:2329:- [translate_table: standard]